MTTNKKQTALENALGRGDLSNSFADNPLVQWISQNGRILLWLILGIVTLFLIGYRLMGGPGGSGKDYLTAEKEIQLFLTAEKGKDQESLARLTALLKSHPELRPKYDGQIAQALIVRGESAAALPFAERSLTRLSDEQIPFYYDYSATTLTIEKRNFAEALQQAQALKAKMDENPKGWGSGLYAANLLRIAVLYQNLGQKSEELKSLETLKQFLKSQGVETFREGKLSLFDYIAFREKELKS